MTETRARTPQQDLIAATERFVAALEEYAAAVARDEYRSTGVLALPQPLEDIVGYSLCGDAAHGVAELREAWRIIDEDVPVDPRPSPRDADHLLTWAQRARPFDVIVRARSARDGDPGFLDAREQARRDHPVVTWPPVRTR